MNRSEFLHPGNEYRGVTLWMLNDELEEEEISRQVRTFAHAGWGALITRTFNGLRTEYLSEDWHRIVKRIIHEAGKLSLKVWLQAGYMPAGVPELPEVEQLRSLVRKPATEPATGEEEPLLERDGARIVAERMPHVLDLLSPAACERYVRHAYDEPMAARYRDDMGKTVETVWVDEPHFTAPRLPWSTRLPARFTELWGSDITESLPSLFEEAGDWQKVRHRYWRTVLRMLLESYFQNVRSWCDQQGVAFSGHLMGEDTLQGQISWTAAAMPCYEYMGLPGIDHLTRSLRWPAQLPFIITPKQCSSAANQLGTELALAEMYAVSSEGISFRDRKRIALWMMMLGINYRCYHGSFYSLRGRRKRIYAPHLSFQQSWWQDNPMIADYFARLSYLMRQGSFHADVMVLHPVESAWCVYDPSTVENPYERVHEPEAVRRLTEQFIALSSHLLALHYGFEYGDESLLAEHGSAAADPEGRSVFRVGKQAYRVVVLPPLITLRESTYQLLHEHKQAGGALLAVGQLPERIDGAEDPRLSKLFASVPLVENTVKAMDAALSPMVSRTVLLNGAADTDAADVWLHERIVPEGRLIVLSNTQEENAAAVELSVSEAGALERWDLTDGSVAVPEQTRVTAETTTRCDLAADGAAVYLFRRAVSKDMDAPTLRTQRTVELEPRYEIERLSPNVQTLDYCRYRKHESDGWNDPMPVAAVQEVLADEDYRGDVSLRYRFTATAVPDDLAVVIEDAELCRVTVNGSAVRYEGDPFFVDPSFKPIRIASQAQSGENTVEVTTAFEPPAQPRFRLGDLFQTASGVELEAIYITGSFAVAGTLSKNTQKPRAVRFAPEFTLTDEPNIVDGQLLGAGYPFFSGRVRLTQQIELTAPAADERVFLRLANTGAAVITAWVNGKNAGYLAWPPYETDITERMHPGANRITFELAGTLRNMLGPHHRPSGEPDQVWGDGWTGRSGPRRRDTELVSGPDWWQHRERDDVYWTDDYFFVPTGISRAVVEYRKPS